MTRARTVLPVSPCPSASTSQGTAPSAMARSTRSRASSAAVPVMLRRRPWTFAAPSSSQWLGKMTKPLSAEMSARSSARAGKAANSPSRRPSRDSSDGQRATPRTIAVPDASVVAEPETSPSNRTGTPGTGVPSKNVAVAVARMRSPAT